MMLTANEVQAFLRRFEPLREIEVSPQSALVIAPNLVKIHGLVMIYGESHAFEADLDLLEFGGQDDLVNLAGQLLKSFAAASRVVKPVAA
jgi:hypothetical protein